MATEVLIVEQDFTTLDLLLWRRFRREAQGFVESTLANNPGLAGRGAYLPVGTRVLVAAPAEHPPQAERVISLYD